MEGLEHNRVPKSPVMGLRLFSCLLFFGDLCLLDGTSPRRGDLVTPLPGQGQTSRGRLQRTASDSDGSGPPRTAGLSHLIGPAVKASPHGGNESLTCAIGEPLREVNLGKSGLGL